MTIDPCTHADPDTREAARAAVVAALRARWPAADVDLNDSDSGVCCDFGDVPGLGDVEAGVYCQHVTGDTREPHYLRAVSWHAFTAGYLPGWKGGGDDSLPGGSANARGEHPDDPCEAVVLALENLADALAAASAGVRALAESPPTEPTP